MTKWGKVGLQGPRDLSTGRRLEPRGGHEKAGPGPSTDGEWKNPGTLELRSGTGYYVIPLLWNWTRIGAEKELSENFKELC